MNLPDNDVTAVHTHYISFTMRSPPNNVNSPTTACIHLAIGAVTDDNFVQRKSDVEDPNTEAAKKLKPTSEPAVGDLCVADKDAEKSALKNGPKLNGNTVESGEVCEFIHQHEFANILNTVAWVFP